MRRRRRCTGGRAVARAVEGHQLADVQLLLRLMYDQTVVEEMGSGEVQVWQGVLELADKLDAGSCSAAGEMGDRNERVD